MKASEYKNDMTPTKTKKPDDATIDADEVITEPRLVELHQVGSQNVLDKLKKEDNFLNPPYKNYFFTRMENHK